MTAAHIAHLRAFGPPDQLKGVPAVAQFDILHEDIDKKMSHHPPNDLAAKAHETVRTLSIAHAKALLDVLPTSPEKSLCWTALREALMWANAAIAVNGGPRETLTVDDLEEILEDFSATYAGTGTLPL